MCGSRNRTSIITIRASSTSKWFLFVKKKSCLFYFMFVSRMLNSRGTLTAKQRLTGDSPVFVDWTDCHLLIRVVFVVNNVWFMKSNRIILVGCERTTSFGNVHEHLKNF